MSDEAIPRECTHIAEEIESLEDELRGLIEEQAEAPRQLQNYYRREIKRFSTELGLRKQQLRTCELQHNPPAQRPDLVAQGIAVSVDHVNRRLKVAAIVKNIGKARAAGPFRIDMAITERSGATTISHVHVFQVPASVVIDPPLVLAENPNALAAIVGGIAISDTYVTEKMEVPLRYIDESPSFRYDIEFLVDVDQVLNESNESNNRYFSTRWFTTPAAVEREKPFTIKSAVAAAHAAGAD
jgi:hypothetical protein